MSEKKQEEHKVVVLEQYRKERADSGRNNTEEHVWERTTQPLLPGQENSGTQEIRIVKVSSGFGRLKVPAPAPAWENTTRCMAA